MARHERHDGGRPFLVALRSLLVPGWGQLAVRRRRLGWTLVGITVVIAAAIVAIVLVQGPSGVAAELTDPGILLAVVLADLALAGFRLAATVHAWIAAGGRRVLAITLLGALVLAPHAVVTYLGLETRSTLVRVFAAEPTSTTTTTTPPPSTTTRGTSTTPSSQGSVPPSSTAPEPTLPTTTTTILDPVDARYNVLLLGGDAGPYRSGLRTDSIILVSVDLITGDAAMFSIPRNWTGLTLSDGRKLPGLIMNEVYQWGQQHPDGFGTVDPGAGAVVDVVSTLTNVPIDNFVLVDITAFAAVIDALGGVTIDVPRQVYGPRYDPKTGGYEMIIIPRGVQTLDGGAALAYVRERYQSSDYDRMDRQRCLLSALASNLGPTRLLTGLTGVLDAIEENVTTDIPLDQVPGLVRLSARVDVAEVRAIRFDLSWASGFDADGYTIPDLDRVRTAVHETITDPSAATEDGTATTLGGACG